MSSNQHAYAKKKSVETVLHSLEVNVERALHIKEYALKGAHRGTLRYLYPTIFQFPLPTIVHLKQFEYIFQCYYSTKIFLKYIFNFNCV